jgi:tetratricopeptide (TPR) repeat protein
MIKTLIIIGALLFSIPLVYAQTAEDYYNSGMASVKKNNFPQAIADFNMAIEIRPDYATAYYARAYAYYDNKEYAKALADARKTEKLGITVDPDFMTTLQKPPDKGK